jgi:hypothetical protein
MRIVVRRGSARPACSLDVKPILSKCADCRSPADGGVHAGGGGAVKKDDDQEPRGCQPGLRLLLDFADGAGGRPARRSVALRNGGKLLVSGWDASARQLCGRDPSVGARDGRRCLALPAHVSPTTVLARLGAALRPGVELDLEDHS